MSKVSITLYHGEGCDRLSCVGEAATHGEVKVIDLPFGWAVDTGEALIVIQFTTRQDGRTSWLVTLTDVDGVARVVTGLCSTDAATEAIAAGIRAVAAWPSWYLTVEVRP